MPKNNLIASHPDERKFQARMDLDTLNRACEIQKDKGRMAAVGNLAKEQMEALARHVDAGKDMKSKRSVKSPAPPAPKRPLAMEPAKKGLPVERVKKSRKM